MERGLIRVNLMGSINGWADAPECWRHFLWPPLRIRREVALIERDGELVIQEAPAVYSIQILGFVLFVEINLGMRA